jgi:hypothetical protein
MKTLNELVEYLEPSGGLRCRTGILLVAPEEVEDLPNTAARHGIDSVDYARLILKDLPPETQFVGLSAESEEERLRRIADNESGSPVLLITEFDVALAKLGAQARGRLWQTISQYLTQTRHGLILAIPITATRLLPEETVLDQLRNQGRIAQIDE